MAAKEVVFADEARQRMFKGVNILANAVKATLGPRGETPSSIRVSAHPPSPKTAYRSRRKSSSKTSSKIWAHRW
jgi:hypothetical protein